jgi:phage/plasmid-like protein (TIGR03299 family)
MEKIQELLETTNLNWSVNECPVYTTIGDQQILIEDKKALVRSDTSKVLSVMSESYHAFQNSELMELLDKVSNITGLQLVKGGSFKEGARVYTQFKSNDLNLTNANGMPDRVKGYITGINSFDGSTSLAFGPSNVTISCMNSFFAAFREMDTKVRHTRNMNIRIDMIARGLEGMVEQEKIMFDDILKLSETRFDDVIKDSVMKSLFNIKPDVDMNDTEATSTQLKNKLNRFYIDLNGELQEKGDNLWGLFSGVTKYTTHSISKGDNTEAKMFDTYGKREKQIFKDLVALV